MYYKINKIFMTVLFIVSLILMLYALLVGINHSDFTTYITMAGVLILPMLTELIVTYNAEH